MNTSFGTKIPDVALSPIAAADPLWPPNLVPHAIPTTPMSIPTTLGRKTDDVLLGTWKR
jgi:hypothetical protein